MPGKIFNDNDISEKESSLKIDLSKKDRSVKFGPYMMVSDIMLPLPKDEFISQLVKQEKDYLERTSTISEESVRERVESHVRVASASRQAEPANEFPESEKGIQKLVNEILDKIYEEIRIGEK